MARDRLGAAGPRDEDAEPPLFPVAGATWSPGRPLMWGASLLLLLAIHTPLDQVRTALAATGAPFGVRAIVPFKTLAFGVAVALLGWPLARDLGRFFRERPRAWVRALELAGVVFVGLSLLCVPFRSPLGLGSLGQTYGQLSLSPFTQETGWYYRRLLMPALAHELLLRGPLLYYFFSLALTVALIAAVALFLGWPGEERPQGPRRRFYARRESWWLLSLGTSSFVFFSFQNPGYPEPLAYFLLLLAASIPLAPAARFAVVVLGMAAHEGSLFFLAPAILFAFPRGERRDALVFLAAYPLVWLASYGFALAAATESHGTYHDRTVWKVLLDQPGLVALGLFFGHKLLWLGAIAAMVRLLRGRGWRRAAVYGATLVAPLAVVLVAIDTSRLVGFTFLGLLLGYRVLWKWSLRSPRARLLLDVLMAANIALPSYTVAPNAGFDLYFGLYVPLARVLGAIVP